MYIYVYYGGSYNTNIKHPLTDVKFTTNLSGIVDPESGLQYSPEVGGEWDVNNKVLHWDFPLINGQTPPSGCGNLHARWNNKVSLYYIFILKNNY